MIRRDYILRMIEEFIQTLARLGSLKRGERWNEASEVLDAEFQRLVGEGAPAILRLSETELLAKVIQGEPTQVVRQKTIELTTLLKEAGDVAAEQGRADESRECYLKALHLLLGTLAETDPFDFPDFVPRVDALLNALQPADLPIQTRALLMQHYERAGDFGRAEDQLFAMVDAEPGNEHLLDFAMAFYRRLLAHRDAVLAEGNLTRAEIEESMKELQVRLKK